MNKIIFLFCCLFFCSIQAKADDRQEESQFTIKFVEQPLDSALVQLARKTGYGFRYQDSIINSSIKVTQYFENKTISQILEVLLANTDYHFIVFSKCRVLIYKMEKYLRTTQIQRVEPCKISGKVVDENGEGVLAVSIRIIDAKGKISDAENAITNEDGTFSFFTPHPNACLLVRYIGYYPQVVSIKDAGLIKLEPDWEVLNEVITIGRDKATKKR